MAAAKRSRDLRIIVAKTLLHIAIWVPAALLFDAAWHDRLGADPIATLTHETGLWALRLLLATLAITPLRLISGWSVLLRFRRMLGLYAFVYASLHLAIYLALDLGGYWPQILDDIVERPFITVGFLAWLSMLPLAATSTKGMMRRLGRHWGRLHKAVYATAILAVIHFIWLVKADLREPLIYAAILTLLLALRLPPIKQRLARRGRPPSTRRVQQ